MNATPGDIGIADVSLLIDGYAVVRVVKPAALGKMWTVEVYRREWLSTPEYWEQPVKRKVRIWYPIGDSNPAEVDARVRKLFDDLHQEERELRAKYRADVADLGWKESFKALRGTISPNVDLDF